MTLFLLLTLVWLSLVLALIPAVLFHINLARYAPPPFAGPETRLSPVSVLIPARNEQAAIGPAVSAVLESHGVEFEVVVLDDHSDDATAKIVNQMAARDARVRLVQGLELPPGWCGKQYACWSLAQEARYPVLVFLDADVRLTPDALARMSGFLDRSGADLASGIPRQETVGFLELMVIPLIHFILLGFLPIGRMRGSTDPGYAAGCGQLFITRRGPYEASGGHAAVRATLHDGIKLPRAYRLAGLRTDLFDATDLAVCRMYQSAGALWNGLAKNAGEALAAPRLIVPMTLILVGGQMLPLLLLILGMASIPRPWPWWGLVLAALATSASFYPRLRAVGRFRQSKVGAVCHPLGVVVLVMIQWYALTRTLLGRPANWKGRPYPARTILESAQQERPGS
jgi:hypothetical protein